MFKYGEKSNSKLETCHPTLQRIADEALAMSPYDITIIHGWRDMETQNHLYERKRSKVKWPNSRHNKTNDPYIVHREHMSDALDFAPYINGKIDWSDSHMFAVIAGCFFCAAGLVGEKLRWGGDWDMDGSTKDQTFMDWGHIEIKWSNS
jgi:peptidoglycan L-alanyl-D-glutamate endopeptidase CwlK